MRRIMKIFLFYKKISAFFVLLATLVAFQLFTFFTVVTWKILTCICRILCADATSI